MVRQAMVSPSDEKSFLKNSIDLFIVFVHVYLFVIIYLFLLTVQEKRGVSNTAGHQLLLNSVETLQRALKGEFNYILIKLIHLALRYSSVISTLKGT